MRTSSFSRIAHLSANQVRHLIILSSEDRQATSKLMETFSLGDKIYCNLISEYIPIQDFARDMLVLGRRITATAIIEYCSPPSHSGNNMTAIPSLDWYDHQ